MPGPAEAAAPTQLPSNPILNNPYQEPARHYATDLLGNLDYDTIAAGRRLFVPEVQAMPGKHLGQKEVFEFNELAASYGTHVINLLRREVSQWRTVGYPDATRVTRELLAYWFPDQDESPVKKLFFAQREAVETAIWLNEVAGRSNAGSHILSQLREGQQSVSPHAADHLPRIAFKMATGTGKTVVMAALILYHYLNRQQYRQDVRFADYFLLVAPGITIRDRLGVLRADTTPTATTPRTTTTSASWCRSPTKACSKASMPGSPSPTTTSLSRARCKATSAAYLTAKSEPTAGSRMNMKTTPRFSSAC